MSEADFRQACERHDLTYNYSDDARMWREGEAQYKAIKTMAAELPREVAVKIWNETVDKKILDGHRNNFYWTV